MSGTIRSLVNDQEQELIEFSPITQAVQDPRFRSQRLCSLLQEQDSKNKNRNTVLISLTGVIVTTGGRNVPSALQSVASLSRLMNSFRVNGCPLLCHANLKIVNKPFYGKCKYPLNLALLTQCIIKTHNQLVVYDKHVFPGARVKIVGQMGKSVFFASGKFLIAGMTSKCQAYGMLRLLHDSIKTASVVSPVTSSSTPLPVLCPGQSTRGYRRRLVD